MWISIIIIGVMLVLSIILLVGKGDFLISGYNTMSKQEKQKYDKKRLSRAVGMFLLLTSIAVVPFPLGVGTGYIAFAIVFFVVALVVLIYYTNRKCFSQEHKATIEMTSDKKRTKIVLIVTLVVVAVSAVFSIGLIIYGERAPVYTVSSSDGTFTIDSMYGLAIELDAIETVKLKSTLPGNISRTNGYGGVGSTLKGTCSSDIGKLLVFLDIDISPFIYFTTSDSEITYIINSDDPEATNALYNELSAVTGTFADNTDFSKE